MFMKIHKETYNKTYIKISTYFIFWPININKEIKLTHKNIWIWYTCTLFKSYMLVHVHEIAAFPFMLVSNRIWNLIQFLVLISNLCIIHKHDNSQNFVYRKGKQQTLNFWWTVYFRFLSLQRFLYLPHYSSCF